MKIRILEILRLSFQQRINFPADLVLFHVDKDFGNPPPDHSNASIFQRIHEDKNLGNPLPNTCSFGKFDALTYYMYPYDD